MFIQFHVLIDWAEEANVFTLIICMELGYGFIFSNDQIYFNREY